MAKTDSISILGTGCELWIEYNPNNLRIQRIEWNIPIQGVVIRARVWDSGQLVIDRTEGEGAGSESIPGNYQMVMNNSEPNTDSFLDLPSNITYLFNMQTIG